MPDFKPVVRKDVVNSNGKANIKIQFSHRGKTAYIGTIYYIEPKYMLPSGKVKSSYPGHVSLNQDLLRLQMEYNNIVAGIGMMEIKQMTMTDLLTKLKGRTESGGDFIKYAGGRIASLRKQGRLSLAELYETTLKHLKRYSGQETLLFKEITVQLLKGFEEWLRINRNSGVNTVANYLCNIRAIFFHAIDSEAVDQGISPFRKYKIIKENKRPRALDVKDLKRLLAARQYLSRAQQREVDIFFLMLYLGGINLKDLLYLKHENHYKGRIIYDRFKTGREYSIRVFTEAEEIINRYQGEKYLLRFMEKKEAVTPGSRRGYEHKDILRNTNKYLKLAGEAVGLKIRLNTYVARYSFATIAAQEGIQKDTIAHVLGHGENTMTDLYIDFDDAAADEAIRKVIDKINL